MLKGSDTIFRRNFFVSQNQKSLQGNLSELCFRKFLVAKQLMDKEGEYQYFPSNFFCLTVPNYFVEEPFSVVFQKISGSENLF